MDAKSDWRNFPQKKPQAPPAKPESNGNGGNGHAAEGEQDTKPHLTVKVKGMEGYVGSAWVNPSKYGGKYVAVQLNADVPAGSVLYLSPRKDAPECLG